MQQYGVKSRFPGAAGGLPEVPDKTFDFFHCQFTGNLCFIAEAHGAGRNAFRSSFSPGAARPDLKRSARSVSFDTPRNFPHIRYGVILGYGHRKPVSG